MVAEGKAARGANLDDDEKKLIKSYGLITLKPTMYIANVSEDGLENNPYLDAVREYAAKKTLSYCHCATKLKQKSRN